MNCLYPRFLPNQDITVPCGHCLLCRMTKSREWSYRLTLEADYYKWNCSFITLTYDDSCLPYTFEVSKDVLQRFFKRLRKFSKTKIKYFACGEYGGQFGRPHYHSLVFGLSPDDFVFCSTFKPELSGNGRMISHPTWPFGFMHVAPFSSESINYVTRYILKKSQGFEYDETKARCPYSRKCKHYKCDMRFEINPPFQLSSQSLGLREWYSKYYSPDNLSEIHVFDDEFGKQKFYEYSREHFFNGKKISTPRYFLRKIGASAKKGTEDEFTKLSREYYHVFNSPVSGFRTLRLNSLQKKLDNFDFYNYAQKRIEADTLSKIYKGEK